MLRPLYDNVVLKRKEVEKKTASGIILTDTSKNTPCIGEIVAVGNGKLVEDKYVPLTVKVGDTVVYKEYATTMVKYENEEYLIVSESDILAVIE